MNNLFVVVCGQGILLDYHTDERMAEAQCVLNKEAEAVFELNPMEVLILSRGEMINVHGSSMCFSKERLVTDLLF